MRSVALHRDIFVDLVHEMSQVGPGASVGFQRKVRALRQRTYSSFSLSIMMQTHKVCSGDRCLRLQSLIVNSYFGEKKLLFMSYKVERNRPV